MCPTARADQRIGMHRATKASIYTTELLQKAFLETSEGQCMFSATQEATKACWTDRKAKENPEMPGLQVEKAISVFKIHF